MYKVDSVNKERWIFISADDSFDNTDAFVALLKEYQSDVGGDLSEISSSIQYIIENDPQILYFNRIVYLV